MRGSNQSKIQRSNKKSQKSQKVDKAQAPLTSFFYTKGANKLPSLSRSSVAAGNKPGEAHYSKVPADVDCEVIDIDDSQEEPQRQVSTEDCTDEPRAAKRARLDSAPRSSALKGSSTAGNKSPKDISAAVIVSRDRIPGCETAKHARFQNKLVTGYSRRNAGPEAIVKQKHTPLELQIVELKKQYPDIILIVEVGYKFRFFGEDAEVAANTCNIFCYPDRNFMTASIPVPRLHVYVRRLVAAGYKVGIVRQTETAALKAAGDNRHAPFARKLTALYTRSTLEAGNKEDIGEDLARENPKEGGSWSNEGLSNYLVCLTEAVSTAGAGDVEIGIVAVETSTGDVLFDQFRDGLLRGGLEGRLMFASPSELLVAGALSSATQRLLGSFTQAVRGLKAETVQGAMYTEETAASAIQDLYSAETMESGIQERLKGLPSMVKQAFAHAADYLKQFGLEAVMKQSCTFRHFSKANEITLSPNALRQLEVLKNSDDGTERGSLLWLLDHTKTAMGGRLMRSWVAHPLRNVHLISERLDCIQELTACEGDDSCLLARLRRCLAALPDLERGATRILHQTASPSELLVFLRAFSGLASALMVPTGDGLSSVLLKRLLAAAASPEARDSATDMLSLIHPAAAEENDKVGLFKSGERFPEVFARREELVACESVLSGLLPKLAKRLRVPRLEYKSVQNQGDYLVEVDVNRNDVPKEWEKVSGTKKVNRYRPPEVRVAMKELEMAKERLQASAEEAYRNFLGCFSTLYNPFRAAASALAALDGLQSLALVAGNAGYVRPVFASPEEPPQLDIVAGRHPVLDALMEAAYVPNDTHLGGKNAIAQLITGPNMGGKSSYIRQVALIAIMAQIGSFVPAENVRLRAIDAVHTRMGASDNLAQGRSTFLEELSETSTILALATESSLVVIDELGRGTSTHDGLAIAHATMQHLLQQLRPLTLFVTHYPKVASLQEHFSLEARYMSYLQEGPRESQVLVEEDNKCLSKITFLYKLVPGVADRSFGLNVARLAKLPSEIIERAAVKAEEMEEQTHWRQRSEGLPPEQEELLKELWEKLGCGGSNFEDLKILQNSVRKDLGVLQIASPCCIR